MAASRSRQGTLSCTLREAVLKGGLPMLVRLEEGFYGPDEATCMSLGDLLALQSRMVVNSQNVVIAYYKNDTSIKDETDDSEEVETYRALLVLSLDNEDIASLRITSFPDPGGLAFSRYVTGIFSDCNWFGQEKELMISMAPLKKDKTPPGPASSGMPFGPSMFDPPVPPRSRERSLVLSGKTLKRTCNKLVTVAATVTRRRKDPAESSVGDTAISPSSTSRPIVPSQPQAILHKAKNKTTTSIKFLCSRFSSIVSQDARRKCDDHSSSDAESDYAELEEAQMDAHQHLYQQLPGDSDSLKLPPPTVENKPYTGRTDQQLGTSSQASSLMNMSVLELCACLKECRMPDLARVCRSMAVDGSLLCSLSDEVLLAEPFLLTRFMLEKWHCVKNGWRPKLV